MQDDARVNVAERLGAEDIVDWIGKVVADAVSTDHMRRSPICTAIKFELKIPMPDNAPFIGAAGQLNS